MKRKISKILGIALSIALVTSLLISAAPAVALSTPAVTLAWGQNVISKEHADYVITFTVGNQLTGNGTGHGVGSQADYIVVTFPAGTVISAPDAEIIAGPGWVDNGSGLAWAPDPPDLSGGSWDYDSTDRTIIYQMPTTGEYIGQSSQVRIEITEGIMNPAAPGDYTLTVGTVEDDDSDFEDCSTLEADVTSQEYSIIPPMIDPLSGIVTAYNSAGIMMKQSHIIQECVDAAGLDGTVEVGPGTYVQYVLVDEEGLTVVGTGDPGTVIIKDSGAEDNVLRIDENDVTIDGITFTTGFVQSDTLISVHGEDATITNCDFTAGEDTSSVIYVGTGNEGTVISNCTFDTTADEGQNGIKNRDDIEVTDCVFTVGEDDNAIYVVNDADISGCTFTGSSGVGIYSDGDATIDDCTFTSLYCALDNGGYARMSNSVVDSCGSFVEDYAAIENYDELVMVNNTIQNSDEKIEAIYLDGTFSSIMFNSFLNNAKNIYIDKGVNYLPNNWWGTADGPALGSVVGLADVIKPYLGSPVTVADVATHWGEYQNTLITKNTVGVDVAVMPGPMDNDGEVYAIGVAKYSGNPELAAPTIMGTGSVVGYYDVFVANDTVDDDIVQIKFYVPVTPYTKVYYAGGISGRWSDAGGDVNLASGFAYVTVGGIDTGLQVEDLGGTVFAVVEDKATEAGPVQTSPTIGSYDVATEPMFTWNGVPGSIRYEIALSEDPTFTIIEWSYNVDQTFYKVDEPLRYDTTYYWRVRGVLGEPYQEGGQWLTPATPWTTGIFTTASEPAPPPDPIVVQPTKPEVNVEIPPTKITIEPAEQAIPNYMLWIIVAVGAILVIALIVLIVRTRRVV